MIWTRENIRNTTLFGRICATEFRNICYFWVDMHQLGQDEIDETYCVYLELAVVGKNQNSYLGTRNQSHRI